MHTKTCVTKNTRASFVTDIITNQGGQNGQN